MNFIRILSGIVIMAGYTTSVMAQTVETVNIAPIAFDIPAPITILETAPLNFGALIVLTDTSGTCVLSTLGSRSSTGGVILSANAPVYTNAAYTVGGEANTTYVIILPNTVTVTSATKTMTIGNFLARPASAGVEGLTGTIGPRGSDTFTVGGTLNVAVPKAAGLYKGTFNVTVAYN